jgi:hypothetical protein
MDTRKHTGPLGALLAVALFLLGSCSTYRARAYAAYMQPRLSGTVALSPTPSLPATIGVDVKSGLGADTENAPYLRGEFGVGPLNATVSSFRYDSSGSGVLNADFGSISQGVPVNADIEILNIRSSLTFDLINVGPVRVAPGFAVDYIDLEYRIEPIGFSGLERLRVQIPAPLGYVQAEVDFDWIAATIDFGAMRVNLEEVDGNYVDFEGMLRLSPMEKLEIFGGYRVIQVDGTGEVDGQGYNSDIELAGWFVGGGVTF